MKLFPQQELAKTDGVESEQLKRLTMSLREYGVSVTTIEVNDAIKMFFPEGIPEDQGEGAIIAALFRHFNPEHMNDV